MNRSLAHVFLSAMLLCAVVASRAATPATPSAPAGFEERFDILAEMLNRDELAPLEMAQATFLATQVFSTGTQAMPYVRSRFVGAKTQGEAGLAGVFLVNIGGVPERVLIRQQAESDPVKRKLIWNCVASEETFFGSIQQGAQWKAATTLLPSVAKCRALAELCMDSRDMLTRRAGLYWGYWVADAAFWKKVQALAQSEPDKPTQRIAQRLLSRRADAD